MPTIHNLAFGLRKKNQGRGDSPEAKHKGLEEEGQPCQP